MRLSCRVLWTATALVAVLTASVVRVSGQGTVTPKKIPITTSSEEARQLYLKGRDLAERLRTTDARRLYQDAATKDANFALAHVGLANTSGTTKEFIDAVARAVALVDRVSEGEAERARSAAKLAVRGSRAPSFESLRSAVAGFLGARAT